MPRGRLGKICRSKCEVILEPALSQGGLEALVLSNVEKVVQKGRIVSLRVSARGETFRSILESG